MNAEQRNDLLYHGLKTELAGVQIDTTAIGYAVNNEAFTICEELQGECTGRYEEALDAVLTELRAWRKLGEQADSVYLYQWERRIARDMTRNAGWTLNGEYEEYGSLLEAFATLEEKTSCNAGTSNESRIKGSTRVIALDMTR